MQIIRKFSAHTLLPLYWHGYPYNIIWSCDLAVQINKNLTLFCSVLWENTLHGDHIFTLWSRCWISFVHQMKLSANWAALTSIGSITMGLLSCNSSNTSVSSVYCISPSRIPTFRDSESLGCSRNCSRISTRFVFSGRNLIVRGRIPRSTGLNKESCVLLCCFMLCFYVVMSMS